MAADTALGNRITSVTTTANNNTISLNTLETKFNTNLADLRAKDAELEEAINQEAQSRQSEDKNIRGSIETVSKRVTDAEGQIAGLQGDVDELQKEVENVRGEVVPKAVAEGIAQVVADAPEDLDTLKEVADYIASDKTKSSQIETAISDLKKKNNALDAEVASLKAKDVELAGQVNTNTAYIAKHTTDIAHNIGAIANNAQAIDLLTEEVATKAPKVGYAPDLKVDFAKELVGRGVAEPQEIGTIRPTGVISIGDGNATITKISGKSVVWNQWVKNHDFTNGLTKWGAGNGATLTLNDDGSIRVTLSGKDEYNGDLRQTVNPIAGHKYAYYIEVKGGVDEQSINIKLGGNISKKHTIYTYNICNSYICRNI
jgi:peptidoglycan hydrolase CwlO-like protein